MLVSCVHPVAILRAVYCTICSLSRFVSDALGDHMVEAYSSTGLVMALYVAGIVSPEARPPIIWWKPAVRPRSMAGGAPTPCGRH